MTVRRQVGVALVLVLWMLVLLTVIANSLVFSSRTELQSVTNLASVARAEVLADAGIFMAIHQLASPPATQPNPPDPARWRADGLVRHWTYQDVDLKVSIIDESGKIDINTAAPSLLVGLFSVSGIDQEAAKAIVDSILDWRDGDDLRHLNGAEKEEYALAGLDYVPANADFETIDQLRQVLGMNANLFSRIESFITVHSTQAGINSTVAPRQALLAVPGVIAEQVDLYVAQRQLSLEQGLAVIPFPLPGGFAAPAASSTYSIQVDVVLRDNVRFVRQAVVRLTGNPTAPVKFLTWRAPSHVGVEPVSDSGTVNSNG